ncbi:glycosyltransferase family A protein [Maribacter sp. 2308TA10-17]|uniref:glycosyltransferase family A protein n=1 Tax=Maribacter sp. 2308TA10-17 TaxID=3386276 RepID=UPI0039BC8D18
MKYYVVIPAHNEEAFLADTLNSILRQSLQPQKVIIVNDNSSDETEAIINEFTTLSPIFLKLNTTSSEIHMPGSKVINAFNKGLAILDEAYDFIVKLDADIILPDNYFERIAYIFTGSPKVGIAGGFIYEKGSDGNWKLNHPMNKNHVRGAFKAYSKSCFKAIGGLKNAMGWDTVDELLAQFNDFEIFTDDALHAKHLRPTGHSYNEKAKLLQGKAMYTMRYGFWITFIASMKMAWKAKNWKSFIDNFEGYYTARKEKEPFLVTEKQGNFIRNLRWKSIKRKLL